MVSYGWGGGESSAELMRKLLVKVGASPIDQTASLFLTKDISLEGELIDHAEVESKISSVVEALIV